MWFADARKQESDSANLCPWRLHILQTIGTYMYPIKMMERQILCFEVPSEKFGRNHFVHAGGDKLPIEAVCTDEMLARLG